MKSEIDDFFIRTSCCYSDVFDHSSFSKLSLPAFTCLVSRKESCGLTARYAAGTSRADPKLGCSCSPTMFNVLLVLDKYPAVRPIGVGEVLSRTIGKTISITGRSWTTPALCWLLTHAPC